MVGKSISGKMVRWVELQLQRKIRDIVHNREQRHRPPLIHTLHYQKKSIAISYEVRQITAYQINIDTRISKSITEAPLNVN